MSKILSLACIFFAFTNAMAQNDSSFMPKEVRLNTQAEKKLSRKSPVVKAAFSPFTGKVLGDKVRMRLQPDLDGYIVRELHKNELISIVGQEGDFYCIEPPDAIKAYIFRSFILDDIVEGNRVNVRLEPDLEAPVIGHLNSGDRVEGEISSLNKKWLEISPPATTHFYVSKEFIEVAGGPELKAKMEKRKKTAAELLENTNLLAKEEMEKPFEAIDFERIKQGYLTIIHEYTDFPQKAEFAKEALTKVQENYLQRRIAYLEEKAALVLSDSKEPKSSSYNGTARPTFHTVQMWGPVEQALYASWAQVHNQKTMEDFYQEQKLVALTVSGVLEAYNSPVRNKPGDFIIKNKNLPVAYVYSTKVNLADYLGKKVTLVGSPRSNNNFAFPAYYVHEVE